MTRKSLRNFLLLALVAALAAGLGHALAQSRSAAEAQARPQPPQLVTGLPDFSALVEEVGPAVVSIEASGVRAARGPVPGQLPEGMPEEMQEAISKAWKRKRVEIKWDESSMSESEEEAPEEDE